MESTTTCSNDKPLRFSKKIRIPIYECSVQFYLTGDSVAKLVNAQFKKAKLPEVFEGEAEGCVFSPGMKEYIVYLHLEHLTHNTIAHELFHLVTKITQDRDIEDNEQQAWLCGWLTDQFYRFVKNKNLTVK